MSRLVFCAHALLDSDEPDWVDKLMANPLVKAEQWCLYRPTQGFLENAKWPGMLSLLTREPKISRSQAIGLRLDPALHSSLAEVYERLSIADNGPFLDVAFKRQYALLRADVVLVDLNVPDHGCRTEDALCAYLAGIPTVGIASRFIVSPGLVGRLDAVLFPRTSDQIVRQVLAFDHKVTATIEYYRDGERRERARDRLGELTDKLGATGAEPNGRNESAS